MVLNHQYQAQHHQRNHSIQHGRRQRGYTLDDIRNANGDRVNRPRVKSAVNDALIERGEYDHFMLKEIHEQPDAIRNTVLAHLDATRTGVTLDEVGFEAEMAKQRARAQASWKGGAAKKDDASYRELVGTVSSAFVGYDRVRAEGAP